MLPTLDFEMTVRMRRFDFHWIRNWGIKVIPFRCLVFREIELFPGVNF